MTHTPRETGKAEERRLAWRSWLDACASVAMIITAAYLLTASWPKPDSGRRISRALESPSQPLSLEDAPILGSHTAKVAIVEYADFQCSFCGLFARETLPLLVRDYVAPGKVMLAFRHLPLGRAHPTAMLAAEAAQCAGSQGKFWSMHDRLFAAQRPLEQRDLQEAAAGLSLDTARFNQCVDGTIAVRIQRDVEGARALGVFTTPTFFIGTVMPDGRVRVLTTIVGARPLGDFRGPLDKLIS